MGQACTSGKPPPSLLTVTTTRRCSYVVEADDDDGRLLRVVLRRSIRRQRHLNGAATMRNEESATRELLGVLVLASGFHVAAGSRLTVGMAANRHRQYTALANGRTHGKVANSTLKSVSSSIATSSSSCSVSAAKVVQSAGPGLLRLGRKQLARLLFVICRAATEPRLDLRDLTTVQLLVEYLLLGTAGNGSSDDAAMMTQLAVFVSHVASTVRPKTAALRLFSWPRLAGSCPTAAAVVLIGPLPCPPAAATAHHDQEDQVDEATALALSGCCCCLPRMAAGRSSWLVLAGRRRGTKPASSTSTAPSSSSSPLKDLVVRMTSRGGRNSHQGSGSSSNSMAARRLPSSSSAYSSSVSSMGLPSRLHAMLLLPLYCRWPRRSAGSKGQAPPAAAGEEEASSSSSSLVEGRRRGRRAGLPVLATPWLIQHSSRGGTLLLLLQDHDDKLSSRARAALQLGRERAEAQRLATCLRVLLSTTAPSRAPLASSLLRLPVLQQALVMVRASFSSSSSSAQPLVVAPRLPCRSSSSCSTGEGAVVACPPSSSSTAVVPSRVLALRQAAADAVLPVARLPPSFNQLLASCPPSFHGVSSKDQLLGLVRALVVASSSSCSRVPATLPALATILTPPPPMLLLPLPGLKGRAAVLLLLRDGPAFAAAAAAGRLVGPAPSSSVKARRPSSCFGRTDPSLPTSRSWPAHEVTNNKKKVALLLLPEASPCPSSSPLGSGVLAMPSPFAAKPPHRHPLIMAAAVAAVPIHPGIEAPGPWVIAGHSSSSSKKPALGDANSVVMGRAESCASSTEQQQQHTGGAQADDKLVVLAASDTSSCCSTDGSSLFDNTTATSSSSTAGDSRLPASDSGPVLLPPVPAPRRLCSPPLVLLAHDEEEQEEEESAAVWLGPASSASRPGRSPASLDSGSISSCGGAGVAGLASRAPAAAQAAPAPPPPPPCSPPSSSSSSTALMAPVPGLSSSPPPPFSMEESSANTAATSSHSHSSTSQAPLGATTSTTSTGVAAGPLFSGGAPMAGLASPLISLVGHGTTPTTANAATSTSSSTVTARTATTSGSISPAAPRRVSRLIRDMVENAGETRELARGGFVMEFVRGTGGLHRCASPAFSSSSSSSSLGDGNDEEGAPAWQQHSDDDEDESAAVQPTAGRSSRQTLQQALRRAATLSSLESVWAEVGAADERRRCARVYTTRFLLITCQRPPNTRRGPDPKQQQHRPALLPAEEELRALLARLDSRRLQIELLMGLADYSTHPKRPLQGRPEWTPRAVMVEVGALLVRYGLNKGALSDFERVVKSGQQRWTAELGQGVGQAILEHHHHQQQPGHHAATRRPLQQQQQQQEARGLARSTAGPARGSSSSSSSFHAQRVVWFEPIDEGDDHQAPRNNRRSHQQQQQGQGRRQQQQGSSISRTQAAPQQQPQQSFLRYRSSPGVAPSRFHQQRVVNATYTPISDDNDGHNDNRRGGRGQGGGRRQQQQQQQSGGGQQPTGREGRGGGGGGGQRRRR